MSLSAELSPPARLMQKSRVDNGRTQHRVEEIFMLLRNKILLAALVAASLTWSPAAVSAQERGLDRAATATARADEVLSGKTQGAKKEKDMPAGIARRFDGATLPPGIQRTRPTPAPAPAPQPEPAPEPQPAPAPTECAWEVVMVDGMLVLRGCNGSVVPLGGTE
jgi:hypothetical protein